MSRCLASNTTGSSDDSSLESRAGHSRGHILIERRAAGGSSTVSTRVLRYGNREVHARVQPMDPYPWCLVTFYDKELLRIANIETTLVAMACLLAYTMLYAGGAGLFLLLRPSYRAP